MATLRPPPWSRLFASLPMMISPTCLAVAELPIAIVSAAFAYACAPKAKTPSCSAFVELPIAIVFLAVALAPYPKAVAPS